MALQSFHPSSQVMKLFEIDNSCPKCGGKADKNYKYFGRKGWFFRQQEFRHDIKCTCGTKEAHICRDCTVCEASWPEMALDRKT